MLFWKALSTLWWQSPWVFVSRAATSLLLKGLHILEWMHFLSLAEKEGETILATGNNVLKLEVDSKSNEESQILRNLFSPPSKMKNLYKL